MYNPARTCAYAIIAFTALAIGGVLAWRALRPHEPHVEIDRGRYPITGLDLSAHNGIIDFDKVSGEGGVTFVYLKATEGADFRDSAFTRNFDAARAAGLDVGPYHFFRFDTEGAAQAANLIATLNGRLIDLPVAIDVEEWGNPAQVPTEMIAERLEAMRARLSAAGIQSLIYTNKNGYSRFVRHRITDADIWICSFTDPPVGAAVEWKIWQHSHKGRVPGVKGRVDLNTFNGDILDYRLWKKINADKEVELGMKR